MALDYSKFSDADLEALANNDLSKVSDEGLQMLSDNHDAEQQQQLNQATAKAQSPDTWRDVGQNAGGMAAAAASAVPAAAHALVHNDVAKAVGGLGTAARIIAPETSARIAQATASGMRTGVNALRAGANSMAAGAAGTGAGTMAGPTAAFLSPYALAAHEKAKMALNPNAPQYANNPQAMAMRGQAPNPGAAGAMNQMTAPQSMNTAGNPAPGTPQFQSMQQQYAPPSSSNFIQRIHALANTYLPAKYKDTTQK